MRIRLLEIYQAYSAKLWVSLVNSNMLMCRVYLVGNSQIIIIFCFFESVQSHWGSSCKLLPTFECAEVWERFLIPSRARRVWQTIIKCSTEPSHNMDFIHQSVGSDTPNDKQKSEAGCSYEDPYPGRLRRLLYPEQIIRNIIYFED